MSNKPETEKQPLLEHTSTNNSLNDEPQPKKPLHWGYHLLAFVFIAAGFAAILAAPFGLITGSLFTIVAMAGGAALVLATALGHFGHISTVTPNGEQVVENRYHLVAILTTLAFSVLLALTLFLPAAFAATAFASLSIGHVVMVASALAITATVIGHAMHINNSINPQDDALTMTEEHEGALFQSTRPAPYSTSNPSKPAKQSGSPNLSLHNKTEFSTIIVNNENGISGSSMNQEQGKPGDTSEKKKGGPPKCPPPNSAERRVSDTTFSNNANTLFPTQSSEEQGRAAKNSPPANPDSVPTPAIQ